MPQFLNVRELSERTGLSYTRLVKLVGSGKVPCVRDSQNRILINLDMFMKALRPDLEIGPDLKGRPSRTPAVTPLTSADIEPDLEATAETDSDAVGAGAGAPPPRSARRRARSRTAAAAEAR